MAAEIPEKALDLLQKPIVCVLITVMPDGQPQATPVWFDFDGTHIRVNTADGRQKARNMERNSKVTVSIVDPQNGYHWLEWRGHVADIKDESQGARDHINSLSKRYLGRDVYEGQSPDEHRQMYVIEADKINAS